MLFQLFRNVYHFFRKLFLGTGISTVPPFSWLKQWAVASMRGARRAPVLGSWMRLDPGDRLNLAVNGVYEPEDTEFVRRVVKPGDVAFDIGANIGYYTLFLSRLVGPSGRVVAFEPAPDLLEILRGNVAYNRCAHVTVEPKAVTDRTGPLVLYMEAGRPEDNRIFAADDSARSEVRIEGVALDEAPAVAGLSPSFIKMDIQGAEMQALRGMVGLLRASPRVCVLLEFWPYGIIKAGHEPLDLVDALNAAGLEVRRVMPDLRLTAVDRARLVEECGIGIGLYINLVAAHPERMRELEREFNTTA